MSTKKLIPFAVLLVFLIACEAGGLSVQDQAATMVALTAQAAQPSETPLPLPTDTVAPPTLTPTITTTPTPAGPLHIKDDFASETGTWGTCDVCEWKDGKLYFGPSEPKGEGMNQLTYLVCKACGEHTYYRISADVTFFSGQAGDRTYGLMSLFGEKLLIGLGISPYKVAGLESFDFDTEQWGDYQFRIYSAVKPGGATNHLEFDVRPNKAGTVDFAGIVNGKTILVLENQPAQPSEAGFYLEWHSVGVTFDNFEYEEIVP